MVHRAGHIPLSLALVRRARVDEDRPGPHLRPGLDRTEPAEPDSGVGEQFVYGPPGAHVPMLSRLRSRATACAASPSPRPVKPSPSVVVARMVILSMPTPSTP